MHMLVWLRGAPNVKDLATMTEEERAAVVAYFDNLMSTINPNKDAPPADVHPCRKRLSEVDDVERDLIELLNKVQRHKCSAGYCQRKDKNTGQTYCRFKFPHDTQEASRLVQNAQDQFELLTARNDPFLNKYIRWVMQLWRANIDATPILSLGFVLRYCAKYASKGEARTQTLAELAQAVLADTPDDKTALSAIQSLLIKTVSERDYSAQEACHILSGRPLYVCSRKFVIVDLRKSNWVELQRDGGRAEDVPNDGADVDDPEAGAAEGADDGAVEAHDVPADHDDDAETFGALVESYMTRPVNMANMSLMEVAKSHGPPVSRRDKRDNRWSNNRREAVVRVFPRPKLTPSEERNEEYYRVQVLLHVPWRTEEQVKGDFGTWKEVFQANNLVAEGGPDIHDAAAAAGAEMAAEEAAERALFEDVPGPGDAPAGRDEWMVAARMGPRGQVEQVELGRREQDISYDWHASSDAYGDINRLRNFIALSKAEHADAPRAGALPGIVYTAEQQKVLDLLQSQIDSIQHPDPNAPPVVKRVIIQGKAGAGKSTVIDKMMEMIIGAFGPQAVKLMAYTGVAALNISGETINSALNIRPKVKEYPELNAKALRKFQDAMRPVRFLIVDEYSMVGSKMLGYMERRCRDGKPGCDELFAGCFVYLVGDVRQLAPIGDPVLYPPLPPRRGAAPNAPLSPEAARGRLAFASFQKSVILRVSQRQADNTLRDALDRLSVGQVTDQDYALFSARFQMNVPPEERRAFEDAVHIYWTRVEVKERNLDRLLQLLQPVARVPAKHHGPNAAAGTSDQAEGLEDVIYLAKGARVMLRSNLWTTAGLVNGALGTVVDIVYHRDQAPAPDGPPAVVMVKFDNYTGPTMADGTVPVPTLVKGWDDGHGNRLTREQFPLSLAWATTVHKSQGLSLDKAVISVLNYDFGLGMVYVALSRCRSWQGMLLSREFDKDRLTSIRRANGFEARQRAERRILTMQL